MPRYRITSRLCRAVLWGWLLTTLVLAKSVNAADPPRGFVDRIYTDDAGDHKYVLFVPRNYTPEKKWPVILFLHGAGERGNDGKRQLTVGIGPAVKSRAETFPFLVVFPQCEDVKGRILTAWSSESPDGKRALKILGAVEKEFHVDNRREILTGWSMGGYGTWSIAAATPDRWAGIVPVSGGGDEAAANKLKKLPIWAFHGAKDAAVRPDESRRMINALKAAGGNPRYDELSDVGHDVWKVVYDSDELVEWMLNPRSSGSSTVRLLVNPGQRPATQPDEEQPFVPAVEIPRAVYVRLGNDMLSALSYSIPTLAPQDALTGRIDDIYDSTTAEGRYFDVVFSGIRYAGKLARAHVKAYKKDRLNIQLGLRDVTLTIGTTYVTGSGRSAVAGPINVVIGSRGPVWLSIVVTPTIEKRKLRLKFVTARFDIPDDDFYVTAPRGVSTRGLGMTSGRVSNALVSGLYGSKSRFENEVVAIVPSLLRRLEEKLEVSRVTEFVKIFWPLPVYRPRVRVWPQEVATDEKGVSILFGVTAAAIDPQKAPQTPRIVEPMGPGVNEVPQSTHLQVGVTPNMLRPLTELLIQSDMARIHVQDIPEKTFALFADRKTLAEAIPDLERYGENVEIWAELILARPLSAVDASRKLRFDVPKAVVSLAIKTDPKKSDWTPCAEFEFQVAQAAEASVLSPSYASRVLRMDWHDNPDIKAQGRFAPGYQPRNPQIDVKRMQTLFHRGWTAWTGRGPAAEVPIADIDFGASKLRLSEVGWSPPHLYAVFAEPGVKISNSSDIPLVYETKGPYSDWGGPYTLKPGNSDDFEVATPLLYRRRIHGDFRMFTLPVGTHSEFKAPSQGGPPQLFQASD